MPRRRTASDLTPVHVYIELSECCVGEFFFVVRWSMDGDCIPKIAELVGTSMNTTSTILYYCFYKTVWRAGLSSTGIGSEIVTTQSTMLASARRAAPAFEATF